MAYIDEKLAEHAWYGIHMGEYKGYATSEWHGMCSEARAEADKALKRAPHRAEEIERIYERYVEKAADYINEGNRIDAMCPSAFITGPANFPTRKKERQISAMNAHYKKWDGYFDKLIGKLRIIGSANEPISSSDADALDRLREKVALREKAQAEMKAANAWYRKHKTMDGFEPESVRVKAMSNIKFQLDTFWFPNDEKREEFRLNTKPFESYQLSNNNAEIKRLKQRIETIEREKERAVEQTAKPEEERTVTICGETATVEEDANDMRLRLFFDGKPSDECRETLKHNGFKWSPKNQAWQRQLTDNARHALRRISDAA